MCAAVLPKVWTSGASVEVPVTRRIFKATVSLVSENDLGQVSVTARASPAFRRAIVTLAVWVLASITPSTASASACMFSGTLSESVVSG